MQHMGNKRYNMREAAKEIGVTRQTLYYWIKKEWIKPKRDYRNFPVFTTDDLRKIRVWKDRLK
jgi:DNA-binding transcriptional MerR regulator